MRLSYLQGADACTADAVNEDEIGPLLKETLAWRIPDGLKGGGGGCW